MFKRRQANENGEKQIPIDLYFLLRRAGDRVSPTKLLGEEMPQKYGDINVPSLFKNVGRLVSRINPDDYDHDTSRFISVEKNLLDETAQKHGYEIDHDSPTTPEEHEKIGKFQAYLDQKHFFDNRRGERGILGGPKPLSPEDMERIKRIPEDDPDGLNYFTPLGKHLYIHHGWHKEDFENHPTEKDRQIAHDLEMNPLLGSVTAGGITGFEDQEKLQKEGSRYTKIPCLGSPTPSWVSGHMEILHGHPGTMEDHAMEHQRGVSNHTHPIW